MQFFLYFIGNCVSIKQKKSPYKYGEILIKNWGKFYQKEKTYAKPRSLPILEKKSTTIMITLKNDMYIIYLQQLFNLFIVLYYHTGSRYMLYVYKQ